MKNDVRVPEIFTLWRHYKGDEYEVIIIANRAATKKNYPVTVIYRGRDGKVWSRPLSDWHTSMTEI